MHPDRDLPPEGWVPQSPGTSYWAERRQFEIWRSMSGAEKIQLVVELNESLRRISIEGLRERHPGATEAELVELEVQLRLGPELYACIADERRVRRAKRARETDPT